MIETTSGGGSSSQPVTPSDTGPSGSTAASGAEPRNSDGSSATVKENANGSLSISDNTGTSGTYSLAANTSSGDGIVWASTQLRIGPWALPITTRGLKDAAVIGLAVVFLIVGVTLLSKQDLSRLTKKLPAIIPV